MNEKNILSRFSLRINVNSNRRHISKIFKTQIFLIFKIRHSRRSLLYFVHENLLSFISSYASPQQYNMYKDKEMLSMPITRTANGIMLVVVIKLATFPNNSFT